MPSFTVFKAAKENGPEQSQTQRPDLTGNQVQVQVTASGLCGTDLHYKNADMVLGHEGVGVVTATGPDVKVLKKGDRVGWGYNHDSCGYCDQCLVGEDTFCAQRKIFGEADLDQGSFSHGAVWLESFLHRIPDGLSDVAAAPLQCAGATVYGALREVTAKETVAIIGVGGLGHLAIQFAAKMGCRVVVLSGSESKKEDAMKLGADEFIAMSKVNADTKPSQPFDRLVITTSAPVDWHTLFPWLAPRSTIHPLTISPEDLKIPSMPLIQTGVTVKGSMVANRFNHRKMLEFAARHDIAPWTEKFPMTVEGIRNAMEALEKGSVRYRAVLIPQ